MLLRQYDAKVQCLRAHTTATLPLMTPTFQMASGTDFDSGPDSFLNSGVFTLVLKPSQRHCLKPTPRDVPHTQLTPTDSTRSTLTCLAVVSASARGVPKCNEQSAK